MKQYKDNAFEDEYDTKIDYESQETITSSKKTPVNLLAARLQKQFINMAEKELGTRPIYNKAGYVLL